ncbi:hypothetical protein J5Y03_13205 [Bacillus sp. RG28]|uniref:Uncharacterized protein n=1 Tax=Gottfriedia endophytica TaxID=2820819 RepID=A0A940NPW4_9BACI|nr:hypothetical protein [Gottfriedia endophytica]MBP0726134.1 hypothetical protein [Gottfriedia endophytica]
MKKRHRKKLHKNHLIDLVYSVSVSKIWREKLFNSVRYKKYIIDKSQYEGISHQLKKIIINSNLRYFVSIIPQHEAYGWEDWDSSQIYFKFESIEFPNLVDFSANNPEVIE